MRFGSFVAPFDPAGVNPTVALEDDLRLVEQGDGGAIVITSSSAGLRGFNMFSTPGGMSHVAAKHGVVGLMRAWAISSGRTMSASTRCTRPAPPRRWS
jgi:NAD(P)-dependent dehydrogenase (short-subunit alcohol dehydrogenase family)